MMLAVRADNYLAYKDKVELSLKANLKIKRFELNTVPVGNINVVKASAIYGPNNSGKTCLILAINTIKKVLLSHNATIIPNWFTNNKTCNLGITFTDGDKIYSYDFSYTLNNGSSGFVYEKFSEIKIDVYGNELENVLFLKDTIKQKYRCPDNKEIEDLMHSISINNILIYTINTDKYPTLEKYKEILKKCANSIEIVDLYNIPIFKTLQFLKEENSSKSKVIELLKNADLDIDNYEYVKPNIENISTKSDNKIQPYENVFQNQVSSVDYRCLISEYNGKNIPSLLYDSTGTKKIIALSSYIIEALEQGKTLIVDDFSGSLHFRLTREIISLFNNIANTKGQLIVTTHDITLLDCKRLFRKDQIWFVSKTKNKVCLYSLDDFTAKDGVRAESDLVEQYKKGLFGAVSDPNLIDILISKS